MSTVNIKLGNNTLTGVDTIKVQDADTSGQLDSFIYGGGSVTSYYIYIENNTSRTICFENDYIYGTLESGEHYTSTDSYPLETFFTIPAFFIFEEDERISIKKFHMYILESDNIFAIIIE